MDAKQDKAFKRTVAAENSKTRMLSMSELLKENTRLQKDLKLAELENEILKKAHAYFEE